MKKLLTLLAVVFCLNGWGQCSISISGSLTICAGSSGTFTASGASTYTWAPGAGLGSTIGAVVTITPISNTVYTVTGTTGTCVATNTLAVTIAPLPTVSINSVSPNCVPLCTTFSATATPMISTYLWDFGNGQISTSAFPTTCYTVATNGVVTLSVTSTDGCVNTATTSIVALAAPSAPILSGTVFNPVVACQGIPNTLSVTPTGTLTSVAVWYAGANFVNVGNTYTPSSSVVGTTVYSVYDSSAASTGCTSAALTVTVTVNPSPSATYTLVQDAAPHTWDIYPGITGGTTPYTYSWNWGDGSPNSNTAFPSHTYSVAGTYSICETVADANGCVATYCQNDAVSRLANNNNSTYSNMVYVNILGGGVPVYQKLLADSVTEFDVAAVCMFTLRQQNGAQQTLSNCVNVQAYFPTEWYAKGDSLYNGKTYKKVSYLNTFQGLMREDTLAKKVYFIQYCNTYEELLYNFSLNEGDTITYNLQSFNSLMTSGVFTVDSIRLKHDYTSYYHKHFYLKNHTVTNNNTLEIIEGVGNVSHPLFLYYSFNADLFGAFPSCTAANYNEALSCKWNNGVKVYTDSCLAYEASIHGMSTNINTCSYCWGATGGIEKYGELEQVTISPNPNNGNFTIETNATTKQTVQVYDVNGRIVLTQTINNKTTIDANVLPSGIYNVSIISNEGVVNKRIVISH